MTKFQSQWKGESWRSDDGAISLKERERGVIVIYIRNSYAAYKRMYLQWSLCTLYLHACPERVTVGDSRLCCGVFVRSFEC